MLLVIRWWERAGFPIFRIPEAARIGGQNLIDKRQVAVDESEFELRVHQNHAAIGRVLMGSFVDLDAHAFELLVQLRSDEFDRFRFS